MPSNESDHGEDSDFAFMQSDCELMQSDCEFSYSSDVDGSDEVSDAECEGFELSGGWKRVPDILSDRRPSSLLTLKCEYSGVNPDIHFSEDVCTRVF